jgi:hypothetical protein
MPGKEPSGYVDPAPHTMIGQMRQIACDLIQEHVAAGMIPRCADC